MEYCFQLYPHANIKYREALNDLGMKELLCLLRSVGINSDVRREQLGGSEFLTFSTDGPLSQHHLDLLARHSSVLMFCSREEGLLRPLTISPRDYLGQDLPEIQKYKGKTGVPFTNMLITLAWCASDYFDAKQPVTVMDPVCGRGTSVFCAVQRGMHAAGLDTDAADIQEADRFFEKYLQYAKLKHTRKENSVTWNGRGVPTVEYTYADNKEHFQTGDTRQLILQTADTAAAGSLRKKKKVELLVADLPYGIQHAPIAGKKPEGFETLLKRCLPAWRDALLPGGAMAVSFNILTLKKSTVIELMEKAGVTPMTEAPWDDFLHPVEQAVQRDLVVAVNRRTTDR